MNWKRQSLQTHFAGCREGKQVKGRLLKGVLDCFPNIVIDCPISSNDTFKDGVYYRKDKGSFIKVSGLWYVFPSKTMFTYYMDCLNAAELSETERKAILLIGNTKYSTPYQRRLMYAIQSNLERKKLIADIKLDFLRYKNKGKIK